MHSSDSRRGRKQVEAMERIEELQQHIRKRLTEIDDLDERRAAREILLEGLVPVFELMEKRYQDLENQICREIEVPSEKYAVHMTVVRREDYDPINGTLYPVVPEMLTKSSHGQDEQEKLPYIIYFSGSHEEREAFERTGEYQAFGEDKETYTVKVRKAECYQQAVRDLYQVFVYNRIGWTTVNTGYADRFYEVYSDAEADINSLTIDFGNYKTLVQNDMLLLWNIEKFTFQCHKFMIPCIDEKYYEHELDLRNYDLDSGYMLGINEDVLKVRNEKNKIIMTSLKESFQDWEAYRFSGTVDTSSHGYTYELLDNTRKSSFFKNYRESHESTVSSRTELFWMVQSFESNDCVSLEDCAVLETEPQNCLQGDMNPFLGNTVFPMETRKILVLYFRRKGRRTDFCEDMVRFFVSQIQISICEYKCVGVLK